MSNKTVFCFGVNGYRDEYRNNYHPASLYREGADEPYDHDGRADEMIEKAFDSLPKEPEEYDRSDSGLGGWVRFDYEKLISGESQEPIEVTDE